LYSLLRLPCVKKVTCKDVFSTSFSAASGKVLVHVENTRSMMILRSLTEDSAAHLGVHPKRLSFHFRSEGIIEVAEECIYAYKAGSQP
jgi:predicted short-subunit dehydrogenase-like oxidoreductase (DUF2520 family)